MSSVEGVKLLNMSSVEGLRKQARLARLKSRSHSLLRRQGEMGGPKVKSKGGLVDFQDK